MAGETLLNTSTLSVSVESGSFSGFGGPIVSNQVASAIAAYRTIGHQYIQLLDIVSNIAGPNLVPVGNPVVHTNREAALHTWNFTSSPTIPADVVGWSAGPDPIDSPWRDISARASNAPSVFLDRKIFGPFTGQPSTPAPALMGQNGAMFPANIVPSPLSSSAAAFYGKEPRIEAVKGVKVQIFTGVTGNVSGICTVGEFTTDVARPLLEAYQTVLEKMYARLKCTDATDEAERSLLWATLNAVTPDATRRMYEKLEVLRNAYGFPIYSPATATHVLRDKLVGGVISVMFDFPVVSSLAV